MDFKIVVGIIGTLTWTIFVLFHTVVLWESRNEPAIRPRNPKMLLILAIGDLFITSTFSTFFYVQPRQLSSMFCGWFVFCIYSIHACLMVPCILRALQYIVLTNESSREKLSFLVTNRSVLKISLYFCAAHYSVMLVFKFFGGYDDGACEMTWELMYFSFIVPVLLIITAVSSCKIEWKFDSFNIGLDLKYCFWCWLIFLPTSILFVSLPMFIGHEVILQFISLVCLFLMPVGTFLIMVVAPLYTTKTTRKTQQGRKKKHKETKGNSSQKRSLVHSFCVKKAQVLWNFQAHTRCKKKASRIEVSPLPSKGKSHKDAASSKDLLSSPSSSCAPIAFHGCHTTEDIFSTPEITEVALSFCKKHFILEILLFLRAVYLYERMQDNAGLLFEQYQKILKTYIQPGCPYEINISSAMRKEVTRFSTDQEGFFSLTSHYDRICIFEEAAKELDSLFWNNFVTNFSR